MKRNIIRFRRSLSRLPDLGQAIQERSTKLWFARVFVVALALAAMIIVLPRSKASTERLASAQTGTGGFQNGKVSSRVSTRLSSAVSGFEDKTVRNSLLPTKKYQVKFDLASITHELPSVDQATLANMKTNQIGIIRDVNVGSNSMGRKVLNADGTQIRIMAIRSAGADSLRVHLEGLDLAPGDLVYVYGNAENSHVAGPYTDKGPFKSGEVWTDRINGDTAIIEYYFKGDEHPFRISKLTHTLAGNKQAVFAPAVKACELDERCFNDLEKDAVGRMDFVTGQGEFVCSGTLLNDQPGDSAPFFLTAAHCISTQDVAQTLEVWWFYQTTSCDSGVLRPDITMSQPTGASLLATDTNIDATLLSITGNIPNGVVFAGFDPSPMGIGTQVF
ncbi:MAG TPA: hypothetical protein VEZ90_17620, partial [Blastocatellia bacterium]|nr:hypothetical protein [Blastocatellia bacterium]